QRTAKLPSAQPPSGAAAIRRSRHQAQPHLLHSHAIRFVMHRPVVVFIAVALLVAPLCAQEKPLHHFLPIEDKSHVSLAYVWLDIAEEATAREVDANGARPTIVSRTLAIWATAMFDAWAAYDAKAVGSRLGGTLRRPESERTLENKKKAISYAS